MVSEPVGVRPTKRCLGDLGIETPDLGVRLEKIDQPVIVSAQAVPEQRDAGGAERVVALTDRVWFYLAIIAEGVPDPQMFALLLDCVPGVAPEDWQPEPSPLAEMNPGSGEIIWSTLFPSEVANAILDLDAG